MRHMLMLFLASSTLLLTFNLVAAESLDARGRALINELGCKACHLVDGQGGQVGPSLDSIGSRLSAAEIRQKVLTPQKNTPNSIMPSYSHLGGESLDTLVEFLSQRKGDAAKSK